MSSGRARVVMLAGDVVSSRIMYHGICSDVDVTLVILEDKVPAKALIERRMKRLGFNRTMGQLMFIGLSRLLSRLSRRRIRQLIGEYGLDDSPFPREIVRRVRSVNSEEAVRLLQDARPDAVVVNGTRIISRRVLSSTAVPFVNTHMGITPKYRGVHGGYWALTQGDAENCGVTVHLVDEGIDTGGVLYQDRIAPGRADNFNTLPVHQIAKAIPLMKAALRDVGESRVHTKNGVYPSKLWYHPTLFEYLKYWIKRGVK